MSLGFFHIHPAKGRAGGFPFVAGTDNAAANTGTQVSAWTCFCFSWLNAQERNYTPHKVSVHLVF